MDLKNGIILCTLHGHFGSIAEGPFVSSIDVTNIYFHTSMSHYMWLTTQLGMVTPLLSDMVIK